MQDRIIPKGTIAADDGGGGGRALAEGSPSHNLRSVGIKLNYAQASSSLARYPHH